MARLRIFLLLAGALLFLFLIHSVGIEKLWIQIQTVGSGLWIILGFYGVIFALDTWGWHFSFPKNITYAFRWRSLFGSRLAGEAINYVTPFAALGGEPVKAQILKTRHDVSWSDGLASLFVAKASFVIGLVLLISSGLAVALWQISLPSYLKKAITSMVLLCSFLCFSFWFVQKKGILRRGGILLARWIPIGSSKTRSLFAAYRLDQKVVSFYKNNPRRFLLSILFHFLGWAAGVVEIYLILQLLQVPVSWSQAWILESFWQTVKALSFLIPATLGTQEGGSVFISLGLGLSATTGIALALIRRIRELVWTALGLILWFWLVKPPSNLGANGRLASSPHGEAVGRRSRGSPLPELQ